MSTELATVDETEDARARADETRGTTPAKRAERGVARYEPIDPEELGVTRRQFFNRGILTGLALGVSGFGAAALAFLWPSGAGGASGKVTVGSVSDVQDAFERKEPFYNASAKVYIQPFPKSRAEEGESGVRRRSGRARRNGGGLRRPVPEVPAPRLPGAVVPDLTVVRVPVPRLQVQPGRREEGRPRSPRHGPVLARGLGLQHRRRHRSRSYRARPSAPTPPARARRARRASDVLHRHF